MIPKEKAQELIHKFAKPIDGLHKYPMCYDTSKQCALIAVDELIKCTPSIDVYPPNYQKLNNGVKEYWQEVKKEIEKL